MKIAAGLIFIVVGLWACYYGFRIMTFKSVKQTNENLIKTNKTLLVIPEEFHIKVVPWGDDDEDWAIHFTNDNWLTYEEIQYCLVFPIFEVSKPDLNPIFRKQKAIELAKELDTYQKCIDYNEREKAKLEIYLDKWNKLPKKPKPQPIKRNEISIL